MPFQSKKQMRWMYANKPEMAKRWSAHTSNTKALPDSASEKEPVDKSGNALLDGPLAHLLKTAASSTPPGLRQAGLIGRNCDSCKYFDKTSLCTKYDYPVSSSMTCDAYEPHELNKEQIMEAGPIKADLGTPPPPDTFKFGSIKEARAARPDRRKELDQTLSTLSHHPSTISGSMLTPLKTWHETAGDPQESHMDKAKKNRADAERKMTIKQAVKAGLLLRCVEAGMTLDALNEHLDSMLKKANSIGGAALTGMGHLAGSGLHALSNLAGHAKDIGMMGLIGGPILLGGLGGYGLARWRHKENPELVKKEELRNEYYRLADEAKRRAVIKRMQDQYPGSVVQLS